jgi:hypothetical protein
MTNTSAPDLTAAADYVRLANGLYGKRCWKCSAGYISGYRHVDNGVCYECDGRGYTRTAKSLAAAAGYERRLVKAREARQAARRAEADAEAAAHAATQAATAAAREAEYTAWVTANPDLAGWLDTVRAAGEAGRYGWILDLAPSVDGHTTPTEKQAAVLNRWHAKAVADAATVRVHLDATVGDKVTVTGTVTKAMTLEGNYGYTTTYTKLILMEVVTDAGVATVKMTTTAEWAWKVEKDQTVTVKATVKELGSYDGRPQTVVKAPRLVP